MKTFIKTVSARIIVVCFVVTLILNHLYGSQAFSKMMGTEATYTIGQQCSFDRTSCENIYFKDYLNKISSLSNASRSFFSNIYIQDNKKGYTGNCPCPYNSDSRGGSCGGRSSYSKGGQITFCYDRDVSDSLIADKKSSMIVDAQKNLNDAVQKDLNVYHEPYTFIVIILFYGTLWFYLKNK